VQYANAVTTTSGYYDQAGDLPSFRLKSVATTGPTGSLQNLRYTYDAVGNVGQITDTVRTATRTFGYDALHRLTSASGTFGTGQAPVSEAYTYDATGSVQQKGARLARPRPAA
jgi:YD repeat-containing protein